MSDSAVTRVAIKLTNTLNYALTVAIEPWAHEFSVPPDGCFELRTQDISSDESIDMKLADRRATIWINTGDVVSATVDGKEVWP
jgi:hypothetical protein